MEKNSTGSGNPDNESSSLGVPNYSIDPTSSRVASHSVAALLAARFRHMFRENGVPQFGPDNVGCLVRISFEGEYMQLNSGDSMCHMLNKHYERTSKGFKMAKLQYIDGLKYTIGTIFIDRVTQGEFVYFNPRSTDQANEETSVMEETFFSLDCKDDCLFIMSHPRESPSSMAISVNGTMINPLEVNGWETFKIREMKFHFGDFVTFHCGVGHMQHFLFEPYYQWAHLRRPNHYIVSQESDDKAKVAEIPSIIEKILHFLPTNVVQKLCFVSSLWDAEALRILRNRVIVKICEFKFDSNVDPCTPFDFGHSQLNQLMFPNWKIQLPTDLPNIYDSHPRGMRDKKTLDDLTWLLNPENYRHDVKSLVISGSIQTTTRFATFQHVVCGVASTLRNLSLALTGTATSSLVQCCSQQIEFRALQSLSLEYVCIDNLGVHLLQPFLQWLIPKVRNIQSLHMLMSTEGSPRSILNEIVNLQGNDDQMFAKLTNITIEGQVSPFDIETLLSLRKNRLRKLVILELRPPFLLLYRALERHADSLEELTLQLRKTREDSPMRINFPHRMPALKSLSLYFAGLDLEGGNVRLRFGKPTILPEITPLVEEALRRIRYHEQLPCLSRLLVWPVHQVDRIELPSEEAASWDDFCPILSVFLEPAVDENVSFIPALRMEVVHIPFQLKGLYHPVLNNFEEVFPNLPVIPEVLSLARERCPLWTPEETDSENEGSIVTHSSESGDDELEDE